MKYTVLVSAAAAQELEEAYGWLAEQTASHSAKWYNGLLDAILSLEEMSARFPLSPHRRPDDQETRVLIHGSRRHAYLIHFVIRGDTVTVLHIRNGARAADDDE